MHRPPPTDDAHPQGKDGNLARGDPQGRVPREAFVKEHIFSRPEILGYLEVAHIRQLHDLLTHDYRLHIGVGRVRLPLRDGRHSRRQRHARLRQRKHSAAQVHALRLLGRETIKQRTFRRTGAQAGFDIREGRGEFVRGGKLSPHRGKGTE